MMKRSRNRRGAMLIALLMAVAILMVLYMVDIRAIFGPSLRSSPQGIEERPWLLEELLVAEGQTIRLPKPPKPTLGAPVTLDGAVSRNEQPRGQVQITIGTDGRVTAAWQAAYTHPPKAYELEGTAAGNIDIKQTYEDAEGKDKSRLFFIAQGPYRLITDDPLIGRTEEKGTVWLLGYLRPDGRADGTLTLTTDREWSVVYEFSTLPSKQQPK